MRRVLSTVKEAQQKVYIPFAGYLTEAHPADAEIMRLNVKNTPQEVCELISNHCPHTSTWIPEPGGVLDVGLCKVSPQAMPGRTQEPIHKFDAYLQEIQESQAFRPLQASKGIMTYFRWAGFQGDLVLHAIETTENFTSVVQEFYVDFSDLFSTGVRAGPIGI